MSDDTRSGAEGLERSCGRSGAGWLAGAGPVGGVELLRAWFAGEAYAKHRHDTYAIGSTDSGVQVFDYRGAARVSRPGQVVVLHPDEVHDGRAGTRDGFGYRIVYVEPSRIADAVRAIRGRPHPLPFVREPVGTNARLARAVADAFRCGLAPLAADAVIVELAEGLLAAGGGPAIPRRVDALGRRARSRVPRGGANPCRALRRAGGDHGAQSLRARASVPADAGHEPSSLPARPPARARTAADDRRTERWPTWPTRSDSPIRRTSRAPSRRCSG